MSGSRRQVQLWPIIQGVAEIPKLAAAYIDDPTASATAPIRRPPAYMRIATADATESLGMAMRLGSDYLGAMDTLPTPPHDAEMATAGHDHEAKMIAAARASVAAGRVVSLEAVEAWVESWDTNHEFPPPSSVR
jgi:hypothetical protein